MECEHIPVASESILKCTVYMVVTPYLLAMQFLVLAYASKHLFELLLPISMR